MHRLLAASLIPAALGAHSPMPGAARDTTLVAITNVTVIDVARGRRVPAQTVVVRGARIAAVGPAARVRVPRGARAGTRVRVVDGRGKYLIPGLVDTHVHLRWGAAGTPSTESHLRWLLANGVTSVRDASGIGHERELVAFRERVERGDTLAPRVYVSGTASVRNVERHQAGDLRGLVRRLAELKVDGIKVIHLTRDETLAAIEEARRAGLPAYGHTHVVGGAGMQRPDLPFGHTGYAMDAVRAGLSGVMHATSLTPTPDWQQDPVAPDAPRETRAAQFDAWWTRGLEGWLARGQDEERALLDTMLARGTWLEPTLVIDDLYARLGRYRGHRGEARIGMSVAEWWGRRDDTAMSRRRQVVMARVGAFVRRFHESGGLVLAGTDGAPLPGFGLADELALLVEAGLPPAAALRAATLNPARAFRRAHQLGSVEPGKLADLVLLDADPLADIRNTTKVRAVFANGHLLDRAALEAMLAR